MSKDRVSDSSIAEWQQIVSDILKEASDQGASSAEADIGFNQGFSSAAKITGTRRVVNRLASNRFTVRATA